MQDSIADLVADPDLLIAECSDKERRVGAEPNQQTAVASRPASVHRHSAVLEVSADDVLPPVRRIRNNPGVNSRIIATDRPVDQHSPRSDPGNPAVSTQGTICVVDDDNSILISLKRLLEGEGYSVRTFTSAHESLEYIGRNAVPVVILDIWMDGMTGMELMAHLCARSPRTHIIFLTGHEDRAAEAVVTQAGAFAFFIKPVESSKFLAAVQKAVVDSLRMGLPTQESNDLK